METAANTAYAWFRLRERINPVIEELASYQLVGGVRAYLGDDG